jgi:6-phosphofructokinase 2
MAGVATLTLNPAVDVAVEVARLEPEHKLRCSPPLVQPGGGGINVARVLHRLGVPVRAVHTEGGATGQRLSHLLAAEQVPHAAVPVEGETRENLAVTETSTGRQYRFVLPGPRLAEREWRACVDAVLEEPAPRWIVASGSLPEGVPAAALAELATRARAAGARFAVDVPGEALREALAAGVSLAKPSLRELRDATGEPLADLQEQVAAAQHLVGRGAADALLLSLGEAGAVLACRDGTWRARGPVIAAPVGTIGAGDCLLAGYVAATLDGRAPEDALAFAVAAASASLSRPGTGLCWPADIERLRAAVTLEAA